MNESDFQQIIKDTLRHLNIYCIKGEILLLGTAVIESNLTYTRQIGGPALGLYQCEPNTHNDIWDNYLKFRTLIQERVMDLIVEGLPLLTQLEGNLYYATAIARIHYLRVKKSLPALNAKEMAEYHKKYYNTHLGKTDVNKSIKVFERLIDTYA